MGDRDSKAWARIDAWALLVTVGWGTASRSSVQGKLGVIVVIIVIIVVVAADIVTRSRIYWGDMMVMNIARNRILAGGRNNGTTVIIITYLAGMFNIRSTERIRLRHTGYRSYSKGFGS